MKSKKEIKEFILETLLPYKENPELCGFEAGRCLYKTECGKTCAIGKWMNEGVWQSRKEGAKSLFYLYPMQRVLKKRALDMGFNASEWETIQSYHDFTASGETNAFVNESVDKLEEKFSIKLPELRI